MKMDKKEELSKRTIALLEKTKKCMDKYPKERRNLDKFLIEGSNLNEWEQYVEKIEKEVENEE